MESLNHGIKMNLPIITISGLPGAGKSTASELLAKKLGYKWINAGYLSRQMAKKHKMNIVEFDGYVASHPKFDIQLDKEMMSYAKRGGKYVLEGRLTGALTFKNKYPAFRVWLKASKKIRAERVVEREKISLKQAIINNDIREKKTAARYQKLYGIDLADLSCYDLIVNSSKIKPEGIVSKISEEYGKFINF
jgi:cytidylate kinase